MRKWELSGGILAVCSFGVAFGGQVEKLPDDLLALSGASLTGLRIEGASQVDEDDLDLFEACASGAAVAVTPGCEGRDFDDDNDADQSDFGIFQRCYSGPAELADPTCAD